MITGVGDKIFWSIISLLFIFLFWLRFVEHFVPLWGVLIVWGVVAYLIFRKKVEEEA